MTSPSSHSTGYPTTTTDSNQSRAHPCTEQNFTLNGHRAVTGDAALRLGRFFGTSGEFWLNLQKLYELRRAEQKRGAEIARLPSLESGDRARASG